MNRAARRLGFLALCAVYLAGSVWWVLSVPRQPEQLLRAVPGFADMVSMHRGLGDRWSEVAAHPVTLSIVSLADGDPEAWAALEEDPGFSELRDLIGRDELVVARVPYLGGDQEPAWVLASWVGGRSQRLRWFEQWLDLPGLESAGELGGWPVWTWTWRTEAGAGRITLALVEGMLIGCTAEDPMAMEMVIDAYNGSFPSVASRGDLAAWRDRLLSEERPDRVFFRADRTLGLPVRDPVYAAFTLGPGRAVDGRLVVAKPAGWPVSTAALSLDGLADAWGDHPIAAGAFPASWVSAWIDAAPAGQVVAALLGDVLEDGAADGVALALFGGDYSGRFKGIKVPTVMAGFHLTDPTHAPLRLRKLVDRWNARYRWGLVPVELPVADTVLWRLEGTSGSLYAGLAPAEQIAVRQAGAWLVGSSNTRSLETLTRERAAGGAGVGVWTDRMAAAFAGQADGYLGFDLVRGSEAFRLAISAYSLKLLFEDASGSRDQRQQLNKIKAWLEVLAKLDQIHLVARGQEANLVVEFAAGPVAGD